MQFDIVTIFPELFDSIFGTSILKRAIEDGKIVVNFHDPRNFSADKHRTVDDTPYGGGPGMVMKVEPLVAALRQIERLDNSVSLLLSAKGERFVQAQAKNFCEDLDQIILVCGRYEGVDERVLEYLHGEISIGDFVLTGGELGAAVIVDAVTRLIPGVLGDDASATEESHSEPGYIEYPHYTRPEDFEGRRVPEVLLSGNHGAIKKWREEQSRKQEG
ncbi:MAG: tRNA (guanosine(37)-N1)-methyltransferase TrmD [Candidatus Kerfeldbacteria bacterium CG_4_9_14_3_um_filter_45_8]|nr:MAG: tRNA (guanosine(37)-N1)-methyltransferase TrmD [Candidatus Kerfeldbacteria bacterium CG_4_9_14_3_um_filter_45_8]